MNVLGYGYAQGKVILMGEHSVVHNHLAIALPLTSLKVYTIVKRATKDTLETAFYQGDLSRVGRNLKGIAALIIALKDELHLPPLSVIIKSAIPIGAGLGSSAAVASSIVQALYDLAQRQLEDENRFKWTQFSEHIVHGNASGIDALTTSFSNAWYYIKNKKPTAFTLNLDAWLVIGYTGIQSDTLNAVSLVKEQLHEAQAQAHIASLGALTLKAKTAITNQDISSLGALMNQAQIHLKKLHVSHEKIDEMIAISHAHNALGAKLSGAGCGGCVIALVQTKEDADFLKKAWHASTMEAVWLRHLRGDQ